MQAQVENLGIKRHDLIRPLRIKDIHASHLLTESALHLAIFDLAGVEDLLEESCLFDALVDADGRG